DPAALCQPGAAGSGARRGGAGSRRFARHGVPRRHLAAGAPRGHRRQPACVHPGHGRVRDPLSPGRAGIAHDRPGAVRRVLREQRLAAGIRGGDPAAGAAGRADRAAAAQPGARNRGGRMRRRSYFVLSVLAFGYAFLYVPLVSVIVYSFNDSRLATVWGGFSTRWYGELLRNREVLDAAALSLRVAFSTATLATILGTMAGLALARFGRFRGRTLLSGMITSPLVMPEVITGLSLLLLYVSLQQLIGWPEQRGFTTITIAHTTFAMAYVTVIVQSRLAGMDESLEEAAMDLGGRPLRVVFDITLPLIAPAMIAGWLLAFTLSLDDLVIASFVSGPGGSTLPMVIFSKVKLGVTPDINALATIIIVTVSLGVLVAWWATGRSRRPQARRWGCAPPGRSVGRGVRLPGGMRRCDRLAGGAVRVDRADRGVGCQVHAEALGVVDLRYQPRVREREPRSHREPAVGAPLRGACLERREALGDPAPAPGFDAGVVLAQLATQGLEDPQVLQGVHVAPDHPLQLPDAGTIKGIGREQRRRR